MNRFQVGKYLFRAGYIIIDVVVLLIVAGPILGAATPQFTPHNELGAGLDLSSLQPQVQQMFSSGSSIATATTVEVPAFNNWFLPANLGLSIGFSVNGNTVYQTPVSTIQLAPFSSGLLNITVALSPSQVAQIQGQSVMGAGTMVVREGQFWTITVDLGQG